MSRAFAPGESEDDGERFIVKAAVLPAGTSNYITPAGARSLEAERERLIAEKTALTESIEDTQRRKLLEQKLAVLTDHLSSVVIVNPDHQPADHVAFGAIVTLQAKPGTGQQTFRIVGVDEVDLNKGWISWVSPLAKYLMDKKIGDPVSIGGQAYEIAGIVYR
jgi:transcription elongation factor GreB